MPGPPPAYGLQSVYNDAEFGMGTMALPSAEDRPPVPVPARICPAMCKASICDRFKHNHGHGKEVIPESRIYLSPYFRPPILLRILYIIFQTNRFSSPEISNPIFPHPNSLNTHLSVKICFPQHLRLPQTNPSLIILIRELGSDKRASETLLKRLLSTCCEIFLVVISVDRLFVILFVVFLATWTCIFWTCVMQNLLFVVGILKTHLCHSETRTPI